MARKSFINSLERNAGYKGYNELVKKLEMMVMGSYPSEHLYPAEDLFLHKLKPL